MYFPADRLSVVLWTKRAAPWSSLKETSGFSLSCPVCWHVGRYFSTTVEICRHSPVETEITHNAAYKQDRRWHQCTGEKMWHSAALQHAPTTMFKVKFDPFRCLFQCNMKVCRCVMVLKTLVHCDLLLLLIFYSSDSGLFEAQSFKLKTIRNISHRSWCCNIWIEDLLLIYFCYCTELITYFTSCSDVTMTHCVNICF